MRASHRTVFPLLLTGFFLVLFHAHIALAGDTHNRIQPYPELEIIVRNTIDERCQASIAVSQGHLFIRSDKHLFCIGT